MMTGEIFKNTVFDASEPFSLMVLALITGALLGMSFDISNTLQKLIGKNAVFVFAADMLSVVCAYLFLFVCALDVNDGILRWHHLLFAFLGMLFYRKTISKIFTALLDLLYRASSAILKTSVRIALYPIAIAKKHIIRLFKTLYITLSEKLHKTEFKKNLKKHTAASAICFEVAPYIREENKQNGKKNRRSSNTYRNSISHHCRIWSADGAQRAS